MNYCPIINNSRPYARSASPEVIHSPGRHFRAFHTSGKNPESSHLPTVLSSTQSVMETDPGPAADKMIEMMAIIILAMVSSGLGISIGLGLCWIWRSHYL